MRVRRYVEAKIIMQEEMPKEDAETIISCKEEAELNVKKTLEKLYLTDNVQVKIHDDVFEQ